MTESAARFVGPVTFTGLTGRPPVTDLWDPSYAGEVHVELAGWADVMVVAPATANVIARAAQGLADDALTATLLCWDGPTVYAPAMHHRMWASPATARNVAHLAEAGASFAGPVSGPLASGESGMGRMAEPEDIADVVEAATVARDLAGRTLLVSAGGTQEDLDPVRYLGNRSTGKMGYALAAEAARRGASALLVSGPTALPDPPKVGTLLVLGAILAGLGAWRTGASPVLVGFAVETEDLVARARGKLEKKNVDLVVANEAAHSFGKETNRVHLVTRDDVESLDELPKREVARRILDRVVALMAAVRP